MRFRLDAYRLLGVAWIAALLVTTLAFLAGGSVALAQTGGNNVTFVKEATPADGSNFVLDAQLTPIGSFGSPGVGDGEFDKPEGIAVGLDGLIIVADKSNHRVQQFDAAGNFCAHVGEGCDPRGGSDFEICTADCKQGVLGGGGGRGSISLSA